MLFEDEPGRVAGELGALLQQPKNMLRKPAFCRLLAQPAYKERARGASRQIAVTGNLPKAVGAQMTERLLRVDGLSRRPEFCEHHFERFFYIGVSNQAVATIQHSTECQQQEKRFVRRPGILVFVDNNPVQEVQEVIFIAAHHQHLSQDAS